MSVADGYIFAGFSAFASGMTLVFGWGWALLVCGAIVFVAGGLASAREGR